jgi:hypothetical protein
VFEPVRLRSALPLAADLRDSVLPETDTTARRTIVRLVLMVFWLLILEGALRKWVAPQYSRWIFFIRDPFVIAVYWYALRSGAFRQASAFLHVGLGFAVLAIPVALAQSVTFGDSRLLPVIIYGWRQYFLYLPLPFVMAATFRTEDLYRFARHAFIAVVLMAPLLVLQKAAPGSAVINRGIADEEALQFQSFAFTGGGIRPSGPFTSTVGVKELVASAAALLFAVWLVPAAKRLIRLPWITIAACGLATCLALSGSRAAFVHTFIVILGAMALAVLNGDPTLRRRALFMPLMLCVTAAVLYPVVFPSAFEAMLTRVVEAQAAESKFSSLGILGRALYEFVDFFSMLGRAPPIGYGLGLGGNGRTFLADSTAVDLNEIYSESDWTRHIVDLGLLGAMFIAYRVIAVSALLVQVVRATRVSGSTFPMLLFGYVGVGLLYGQLTGHGTVGGFLWLFAGLCMASCRLALEKR